MKVKENKGAPDGNYEGTFSHFIKTSKGGYIHKTQNSVTVRYIIKTVDGIELPGSFPWGDLDDYRTKVVLGSLGVPLRALVPLVKKLGTNQFFAQLEKKLKREKKIVSCWIPKNSTGWIATIKPLGGVFTCKFVTISSRDENTNLPIHTYKEFDRIGRQGNRYIQKEDSFNVVLEVISGEHEGAAFTLKLDYRIVKENGVWVYDKSGGKGKLFDDFFTYHGIDIEKIEPEKDFDDSENGLPELETMLQSSDSLLNVEVKNGWIEKISKSPNSVKITFDMLDEDKDKKPKISKRKARVVTKTSNNTHAIAQSVLKTVFSKEFGDRWEKSGSNSARVKFRKFAKRNNLPYPSLDNYTIPDIKKALNQLGYDDLANNIKGETQKPKRRVIKR